MAMEAQLIKHNNSESFENFIPELEQSSDRTFIQANTVPCSLIELKEHHVIPVFVKDNEPVISHADFIDATLEEVEATFSNEIILNPNIRVSHPIKGRIPEARNKRADDLLDHEKTLYFERMAFVIEIPTVNDVIDGNSLSLTIGGVKAYNLDNLYNKKGSGEHFKIFIGFQNKVCTNLCVWSDGYMSDVCVKDVSQLKAVIKTLIERYNRGYQLHHLKLLSEHFITEQQFANLIGRCRMYNHLSAEAKNLITPLMLGDSQINSIARDFYKDDSFCRSSDGNINLWKLFNLLTGSNKSSYIDTFLDRSVNAFDFTEQIRLAVMNKSSSWYLN